MMKSRKPHTFRYGLPRAGVGISPHPDFVSWTSILDIVSNEAVDGVGGGLLRMERGFSSLKSQMCAESLKNWRLD